jgi:hypothetical protein
MIHFRRTIPSLASSVLAATGLALAIAEPAGAADEAMVRVLHASPDAPAVDVYLDETRVDVLTNVPFGTISGYLMVPAGAHDVKVVPTGAAIGDAVIDADVTVTAGTRYTIAATNAVASIEAQVLVDEPRPTAASAQLRIVHFSADTPAVDVRPDGGSPIATGLAYPNASAYLDVPGGTYDLEVCATGTDTCPLDLDPVSVANGTSYSAFAIGSLEAQTLTAVVAVDAVAAPHTDTVDTSRPGEPYSAWPLALLISVAVAVGSTLAIRLRATGIAHD